MSKQPKCNFILVFILTMVTLMFVAAIMLDYDNYVSNQHYYNEYKKLEVYVYRIQKELETSESIRKQLSIQLQHQDSIIKILNDEVARLHGRPLASFYKPKN